ncbi:hypothetical protein DNTS_023797 [Danionella cerebrum]|uniref:Uncharacterized protein n=1 Tax=Danionella cerebrum TaxID=2873325 RepID=A0A553QQG3_9TELE|nr:hypothetical protein DNTS_023797 [Danionella translucida]
MSRFRRYKYATSLPTWSPLMPRPPPPRNPSSKVNDCHEYSSRGHTVKEPIPRHIPAGFGAAEFQCKLALQQTQAAPSVKTSGSERRGFAEQNLGDLELQLKPSHQSAEEYLSNHHLSLEIPASTYLLILDNSGESVASCERPKVQLLTSSSAEFQCKLALQQTQAAPSVKTSGSKRRGFAEQNLGDLELQLKPSHQSAEEYLSNHHLSLEIPASTYLLILDNSGESLASCERPKVQLLTSSCPCTLGCS